MRPFAARSLAPGHLPPALARPFALRGQDCAVSLFCPYCAASANCAASTNCAGCANCANGAQCTDSANGTNSTTCAIVLPAPTGLGWQQLGLLSVCPTSGHCKFQAQKTFKPARCPEQQRASRRKTCRNKTAPSAADARRDAVVPLSLLSTTHCNCWPEPEYLYNTSQYPCRCTFAKTPAYGLEKPYLARTACPSGESTKSMNAWPILGLEPVRATAMG